MLSFLHRFVTGRGLFSTRDHITKSPLFGRYLMKTTMSRGENFVSVYLSVVRLGQAEAGQVHGHPEVRNNPCLTPFVRSGLIHHCSLTGMTFTSEISHHDITTGSQEKRTARCNGRELKREGDIFPRRILLEDTRLSFFRSGGQGPRGRLKSWKPYREIYTSGWSRMQNRPGPENSEIDC